MLDLKKIAKKWQKKWNEKKLFRVEADKRKKYYIAIVYPYMSGILHLGHLFTYTSPEIMLRYKRMQGFNVLAKFGFHCTGTPIVAAAQRVKEKEPGQIETLRKMGISEKELPKFTNPKYWCEYFPKETLKDIINMGFAIDERYTFKTTYLNPPYDAFIKWQFNKLKEKGYIKKGNHPVVWCPKDNLPAGDHDRAEGEGETPQEFLLFKHKLADGRYMLSATLRYDTVLGITNLFVNPDIDYNEILVNGENSVKGEKWILGEKAIGRLKEQGFNISIIGRVSGKELIGEKTTEFDGSKVLILPANFLKPDVGTGLVHSVPSDSPDDLIALKEIQKDENLCRKFKLNIGEIKNIKPIPVLNTPEYGDTAAEAMLRKYNIRSQKQTSLLEKAKKEIYKISHYTATFNHLYKNAFSVNLEGKKVEQYKDIIKKELIEKGFAVKYYEPTGKVVCRCLTECIIKLVSDQWFIEYNEPKWKKLAHKCLKKMEIYPEKARKQFEYVIDWLDHWACTREFGLGTRLPWDEKWVIESLSDSTIQMAYCTIAKYLEHPEEYGFATDKLNDKFFDFVFLGRGSAKEAESSTRIHAKMIETMKKDFQYWYPFDFRNSAKDLVQNHLAFCIFNHTALFPEKYWPRAFIINGRIMVNNEKMSKSKGNFFTVRELYEKHGPDAVRLAAANAGEGIDDANYDMAFLETSRKKLAELYNFISGNYNKGRTGILAIDRWLESKINESVIKTTDAIENMLFKSAVQYSFLDMQRSLRWYLNRTNNNPNKDTVSKFIETILKLMAPVTPHFSEECWELIGKNGFVSNARWPEADKKAIKPELEYGEELIMNTMKDIREVQKLAKIESPGTIKIFISHKWKYELFKKTNELLAKTQNTKEILNSIMKNSSFKAYVQHISKFLPGMIKARKIPKVQLTHKEELSILKESIEFIKNEFKSEIIVLEADKSTEQKATNAFPGRPAILII